ncbi:MAG TPA: glycoside hydrolase family 15 protein [Thermoanaerobaculia bacterium]|nr:glycoside hydrolase family 15 protein [Thermoanaerobaculia bacterium]
MAAHPSDRYRPIADYAIIGNGHTAALVSREGSIDWLCWPFFDSGSVFARILDADRGGHFFVRPRGECRAERRYIDGTNILQTTFTAQGGVVRLTDLMPAPSSWEREQSQVAVGHLLRRLECLEGEVDITMEMAPRPNYGRVSVELIADSENVVKFQHLRDVLALRSDVPMRIERDVVRADGVVRAGEIHDFIFGLRIDSAHTHEEAEREIRHTIDFWEQWSQQLRYDGVHRDIVLRSALVLKLMDYSPTGAIIAAPTTSLPESMGGVRNWDYRFCWLRDATFTVRALFDAGFRAEAGSFAKWLIGATQQTEPRLKVLYGIRGESRIDETILDHFEGYRASRPVRLGNAASGQWQLDMYGELLGALDRFAQENGELPPETKALIVHTADLIAEKWELPDEGIWEIRSEPRQHVHSKAMAWMALDSAIDLAERWGVEANTHKWKIARRDISDAVFAAGIDRRRGTLVATFGGRDLDASLLYLSRVGLIEADDPVMLQTIDAVRDKLGHGPFIYRYLGLDDGLPGKEGAFLAASFWMVECLAMGGRRDEAHEMFETLMHYGNDVGLYSEQIDPGTGEFLGNFPQALTHIALLNAALTLAKSDQSKEAAQRRHRPGFRR